MLDVMILRFIGVAGMRCRGVALDFFLCASRELAVHEEPVRENGGMYKAVDGVPRSNEVDALVLVPRKSHRRWEAMRLGIVI